MSSKSGRDMPVDISVRALKSILEGIRSLAALPGSRTSIAGLAEAADHLVSPLGDVVAEARATGGPTVDLVRQVVREELQRIRIVDIMEKLRQLQQDIRKLPTLDEIKRIFEEVTLTRFRNMEERLERLEQIVLALEGSRREEDVTMNESTEQQHCEAPQTVGNPPTLRPRRPKTSQCPVCLGAVSAKDMRDFRCSACNSFWLRLVALYEKNQKVPLCQKHDPYSRTTIVTCPGCRRARYERALRARHPDAELPLPSVNAVMTSGRPKEEGSGP